MTVPLRTYSLGCLILKHINHTVHTFNSYTSRTDACQWLVVQTPTDNKKKDKPSTSATHVGYESEIRSVVKSGTCGHIHAQDTGLQSGVWLCILPGLPSTHSVQELNTSTVVCGGLKTRE